MNLKADVSYLRGLIEGGGVENEEKRAAIWDQLMNICDGLVDGMESLSEYVEALDEDLSVLESQLSPQSNEDDDGEMVKETEY